MHFGLFPLWSIYIRQNKFSHVRDQRRCDVLPWTAHGYLAYPLFLYLAKNVKLTFEIKSQFLPFFFSGLCQRNISSSNLIFNFRNISFSPFHWHLIWNVITLFLSLSLPLTNRQTLSNSIFSLCREHTHTIMLIIYTSSYLLIWLCYTHSQSQTPSRYLSISIYSRWNMNFIDPQSLFVLTNAVPRTHILF